MKAAMKATKCGASNEGEKKEIRRDEEKKISREEGKMK